MLKEFFKKSIKMASVSSILVTASAGQVIAEEKMVAESPTGECDLTKANICTKISADTVAKLITAANGILGPNSVVTLVDPGQMVFSTQDFTSHKVHDSDFQAKLLK